jgi:uncharacterized Fe-S cluster-containing radical SAM superfamily protein
MPDTLPPSARLAYAGGDRPPAAGSGGKFIDPLTTATGEPRAHVSPTGMRTLWINTGSLCNIACASCYIESSPTNDRLAYIAAADVARLLDEAATAGLPLEEVGFTGGEPFMNRELVAMLADVLDRGHRALVLTNAMKPMQQRRAPLLDLRHRYGERLVLRVSIDHHDPVRHERIRGAGTWAPMLAGLRWLAAEGFRIDIAGRRQWGESEADLRAGFRALFAAEGIAVDADDPAALVLFPEMDPARDVPEITTRCWQILGRSPAEMMCASSRMVVKRRGADRPVIVPCTLLPYDPRFELGTSLAAAARASVALNHPFCAQFCVLGGASCSAR